MRSKYQMDKRQSKFLRGVVKLLVVFLLAAAVLVVGAYYLYYVRGLQPVSTGSAKQAVVIAPGASSKQIAGVLKKDGLIRDSGVFYIYLTLHHDRGKLQAGTYKFSPNESVPTIVSALVHGKVASDLVTIVPGTRLDQVRASFIKAGFKAAAVDAALQPNQYRTNYKIVADAPTGATLEGLLYPDSYQKTATTDPTLIIEEALSEMQQHLTPELKQAFTKEGLTTYQGITLASMVESEVSKTADRPQVAQVFLTRLKKGMPLGSDVTAFYGAIKAGATPSVNYDSPYNTLLHTGLPPGPISTVSDSSLQAAAHPANTAWLYFVTGDNGTTYFSKTLAQHQAYTQQYCHKLCQSTP